MSLLNFSFLACLEVARLVRLARLARLVRLPYRMSGWGHSDMSPGFLISIA